MKAAICTTVADAEDHLDFFIQYHTLIGFSHIIVFIDDESDESYRIASRYSNVVPIMVGPKLRELWKLTPIYRNLSKRALIDEEVMIRQELNVFVASAIARRLGANWLLHIDIDELFFLNGHNFNAHFEALEKRKSGGCIYTNYEAIPRDSDAESIYLSTNRFKKNYFRRGAWTYSDEQKDFIHSQSWLPNHYFHYYQNGKSAAFLHNPLMVTDVHSMCDSQGNMTLGFHYDPVILHFPCTSLKEYTKKYRRLGDFGDMWNDQPRAGKFIDRFHLESRDVFNRDDKQQIEHFYRERMLLSDSRVSQLLDQGLAVNIDEVRDLYDANRSHFSAQVEKGNSSLEGIPFNIESLTNDNVSEVRECNNHLQLGELSAKLAFKELIEQKKYLVTFPSVKDGRVWLRRNPVFKDNKDYSLHALGDGRVVLVYKNTPCIDCEEGDVVLALKGYIEELDPGVGSLVRMTNQFFLKDAANRNTIDYLTQQYAFFSELDNDGLYFEVYEDIENYLIFELSEGRLKNLVDWAFHDAIYNAVKNNNIGELMAYVTVRYPRYAGVNWAVVLSESYLSEGRDPVNIPKPWFQALNCLLFFLGGTVLSDDGWRASSGSGFNSFVKLRDEYHSVKKQNVGHTVFLDNLNVALLYKHADGNHCIAVVNFSDQDQRLPSSCFDFLIDQYAVAPRLFNELPWLELFSNEKVNLSRGVKVSKFDGLWLTVSG